MAKKFLDFLVMWGKLYLAVGGPTSRLELLIEQLAHSYGAVAQAYATPTGIFLTLNYESKIYTEICRVKSQDTNFIELQRLENLLDDLKKRRISLDEATDSLHNFTIGQISQWLKLLSFFILGFASSYGILGKWVEAVVAGFVTIVTLWFINSSRGRLKLNSAMSDFLAVFIGFVLAGMCSYIFKQSSHVFFMGVLIYIVPGLAITNAVSELASQNLVSGSAKLMKSVLTLFAMGTAAYLFIEIHNMVALMPPMLFTYANLSFQEVVFCQLLMIISFCLLFRVPFKALPYAIICGMVSWAVFRVLENPSWLVLRSFLPALVVGLVSLGIGRLLKMPSQFFSVPGVLALVPGMLALSLFQEAIKTVWDSSFLRVALTASAIVFGLLTARIPFNLLGSSELLDE